MTADFSRNSHRPERGFSAVRLQQGRVQLDADWNEQVDIITDAIRHQAADLIGASGTPASGNGFRIVASSAIQFDGESHLETVSTTALSVSGRTPFAAQVVVSGGDTPPVGALCSGHDVSGRVWYKLIIEPDGALTGQRGLATDPISTEPIDWDDEHHVALAYDGESLQIWVDGTVRASESRTDELIVEQVDPVAPTVTDLEVAPVIEGEESTPEAESSKPQQSPASTNGDDPNTVPMSMAFCLGSTLDQLTHTKRLIGEIRAARLWADGFSPDVLVSSPETLSVGAAYPGLVGDWHLNDGFGSLALDASNRQHTLHQQSANDGTKWILNAVNIEPGQFYVDGIRCSSGARVPLDEQPLCPQTERPTDEGVYVAYLDTWERTVSSVEDASIREVALGGVDTSVRTQIVPQVRILKLGSDPGEAVESEGVIQHPAWRQFIARHAKRGELAVRRASRLAAEPLENRLYRVEIHRSGRRLGSTPAPTDAVVSLPADVQSDDSLGFENAPVEWECDQWVHISNGDATHLTRVTAIEDGRLTVSPPLPKSFTGAVSVEPIASFIWSDSNASDAFIVEQAGATELFVRPAVRTSSARIVAGDVVSVSEPTQRLTGSGRLLRTVVSVGADGRTVHLNAPLPPSMVDTATGPMVLRLWRTTTGTTTSSQPVTDDWMELEHGIEVHFGGLAAHTAGDAWLAPSRSQTRDVVWPQTDGRAAYAPPQEGGHHIAPLAVLRVKEGGLSVTDCRVTFRPLAWEHAHAPNEIDTLEVPENLRVGGDAEVGGTLTASLLRGNLASGTVDTQHIQDRAVSANKLGTGAVGLRQIHAEVGVVPSGFGLIGESPIPPVGYTYTHQQVAVANHQPVWRQRLPLAGTDTGRVVCVMVEGALFALLDNGQIWRSEAGSGPWHLDAEMRPIRRDFAAAVLRGRIHILGGMNAHGKALADHDIYDPEARTWAKGPHLPTPVSGVGAAVVDGVLFVLGGFQGWFLPTVLRRLIDGVIPDWFLTASRTSRAVYALDPAHNRWLASHPMPTGRSHMGVAVSNNRIHAVGGNRRHAFGTAEPSAAHESYLPAGGLWEHRMPLSRPSAYLGLTSIDGHLHAIGGLGWAGLSTQHLQYSPLSDSWTPSSPLPTPARDMGVTDCYGEVYALGGVGEHGPMASAQSCNVSQTLYIHQKNDGGVGRSQSGDIADTASPSAPGGSGRVGTDTLAPIAALAASVAAVSAASLAMDPDHASQGNRGAPAIPGGGASAPALDTPSKVKQGGGVLATLIVLALVLGLLILLCSGGLTQFPAAQQHIQKRVQKVFPSVSLPFAPPAPAAEADPAPDLSRCLPVENAANPVDAGVVTDQFSRGVDVSHYQKNVPWNVLQQAGITYGFAKATQGKHMKDKSFASHWQGMKDCGMLRGAYHFYTVDQDPFHQAQHFLKVLGSDVGELPPIVDVERGHILKRSNCKKLLPNIVHFVQTVERGTGMRPMVYASHGFWNKTFQCSDIPEGAAAISTLAEYPLWIAQYTGDSANLFGGWTEYAFWQYTDKGTLGKGPLDLNRFAYGTDTLKAWVKALKSDPTATPSSVAATMPADPTTPATSPPPAAPSASTPNAPSSPTAPTLPAPPSAPAAPTIPAAPSIPGAN